MSKAVRTLVAFALLAISTLTLTELGHATSVSYPKPEAKDVSVRKWVDAAHEILLARVVAVERLVDPSPPLSYDMPTEYKFKFETIERIKGNSPATFTLVSHAASEWPSEESVATAHNSLGLFWLAFIGGDWHAGFKIDRTYLLFRTQQGDLSLMRGREAQLISSAGDAWLLAVKRLVANRQEPFGRSASIVELLTMSHAVMLVGQSPCVAAPNDGDGTHQLQVKEQLWGLPISDAQARRFEGLGYERSCDQRKLRLVILLKTGSDYGEAIRLRVEGDSQTVDFTGLVNGTGTGLIESWNNVLWLSQVRLTGPLKWTLADLRVALRNAAAGRTLLPEAQ